MPDEASTSVLCPPLLAAWGRDTAGGAALLTACVEAAAVYLLRWRGEPALARAACSLLASLARLSAAAPLMPPWAGALAPMANSAPPRSWGRPSPLGMAAAAAATFSSSRGSWIPWAARRAAGL